ncbi:MAG: radical SAM protein [Elusimicrobia bacterium]|nr:radical SAM protein [Elusimicrobiota bacterium]
MRIQTMSVIVGDRRCNARCPYCISRMTPSCGVAGASPDAGRVDWRNFDVACRFAQACGVTTVLLTGKGEPTLQPALVTAHCRRLAKRFPFVELQTNGHRLQHDRQADGFLRDWHRLGLTTVCVSLAHHDAARNAEVFRGGPGAWIDPGRLVARLHARRLTVRLTVMLLKGYIDSPEAVDSLIGFCRRAGVEQLTVRPIERPAGPDSGTAAWVARHRPDRARLAAIHRHLERAGTRLMELAHGAVVYDVGGQNVCLSNCLTRDPKDPENLRQIIFYPDGRLRYDWQYAGAIIL